MEPVKRFLFQTQSPIWWNILSAIAGGLFILLVVPFFNERFEYRKIQTSYIITKLSQLEASSDSVIRPVNQYARQCTLGKDNSTEEISTDFHMAKFELNLRAVEAITMLKDDDAELVLSMQETLSKIQIPDTCDGFSGTGEYATYARELKLNVLRVSQALASAANL